MTSNKADVILTGMSTFDCFTFVITWGINWITHLSNQWGIAHRISIELIANCSTYYPALGNHARHCNKHDGIIEKWFIQYTSWTKSEPAVAREEKNSFTHTTFAITVHNWTRNGCSSSTWRSLGCCPPSIFSLPQNHYALCHPKTCMASTVGF